MCVTICGNNFSDTLYWTKSVKYHYRPGGIMSKLKDYIQLHLNILLFSLTSVFSKAASVQYNKHGLSSPLLYLFLFLMVANCGIYAITWQQVIKKFSLSTAYAIKVFIFCGRRYGQC